MINKLKLEKNYWSEKVAGSELAYAFNDTYNSGLMVVFNATDKSLAAIAKRYDLEAPEELVLEDANGRCWWHKKLGGCFIAIKPLTPSDMFMVLSHELAHWINSLYEDRGLDHNGKNDEPTAYLTGWAHKHLYHTAVDAAHAWNKSVSAMNKANRVARRPRNHP